MLEGIVEHHDLGRVGQAQERLHPFYPLFGHGYLQPGKLQLQLPRLIANAQGRIFFLRQAQALGGSAITPRQCGTTVAATEQLQQQFRERGLARSAHCKIAHRNHRQWKGSGGQPSCIKEAVANSHQQTVKQRKGPQEEAKSLEHK